jgi:hypothetical protein
VGVQGLQAVAAGSVGEQLLQALQVQLQVLVYPKMVVLQVWHLMVPVVLQVLATLMAEDC